VFPNSSVELPQSIGSLTKIRSSNGEIVSIGQKLYQIRRGDIPRRGAEAIFAVGFLRRILVKMLRGFPNSIYPAPSSRGASSSRTPADDPSHTGRLPSNTTCQSPSSPQHTSCSGHFVESMFRAYVEKYDWSNTTEHVLPLPTFTRMERGKRYLAVNHPLVNLPRLQHRDVARNVRLH
jgi:hypothetical protein